MRLELYQTTHNTDWRRQYHLNFRLGYRYLSNPTTISNGHHPTDNLYGYSTLRIFLRRK
jgi:hypothetical protein